MKKCIFIILVIALNTARADWSESYGGDGVVSSFIMIARSMASEMEKDTVNFNVDFTTRFKESINQTLVTSADRLFLNGVEKDAINYTLVKPYRIEVSRSRWLQYDLAINTQEKLVLHEYLFTLRMDDSNYELSNQIYKTLLNSRLASNDYNRLGPHLLNAASECNSVKVFNILTLGVNRNYVDSDNHNALFEAANAGCDDLVSQFIGIEMPVLMATNDGWDPLYSAFVRSHQSRNIDELSRYSRIITALNKLTPHIDINTDAQFNQRDFPTQKSFCSRQTMLMRSIIGINFYTDEVKQHTQNVRNYYITKLLLKEGSSRTRKDDCGKSALDYAEQYNINIPELKT